MLPEINSPQLLWPPLLQSVFELECFSWCWYAGTCSVLILWRNVSVMEILKKKFFFNTILNTLNLIIEWNIKCNIVQLCSIVLYKVSVDSKVVTTGLSLLCIMLMKQPKIRRWAHSHCWATLHISVLKNLTDMQRALTSVFSNTFRMNWKIMWKPFRSLS